MRRARVAIKRKKIVRPNRAARVSIGFAPSSGKQTFAVVYTYVYISVCVVLDVTSRIFSYKIDIYVRFPRKIVAVVDLLTQQVVHIRTYASVKKRR